MDELSEEDKIIVSRAKRIQKFLTQPLFTAEFATGIPGRYVSREQTVKDFEKLLMVNVMICQNKHFIWLDFRRSV